MANKLRKKELDEVSYNFSKTGPNAGSVREAHVPYKSPAEHKPTLGDQPKRYGIIKSKGNQNHSPGRYGLTETIRKVVKDKLERGRTSTGQQADSIDTEAKDTGNFGQQ